MKYISRYLLPGSILAGCFVFGLLYACTPKHLSASGDTRVYNDDSEITMKAKERSGKMPFDTASAPVLKRR